MVVGTIATNLIMNGPSGILLPLGFENYMDIATARMYYNYIATILLVAIAATAGTRAEPAYCVITPIFAGMFMLFGWLSFANHGNAVAVMVITGVLGVMIYMNETNHEKNGLAGPGSKLLNVVFFIIMFQVILGVMPALGTFDSSATNAPSYGQAYCPPSANCASYSNVDVKQSMSSTADGGGFLSGVVSIITGSVTAFIAMLTFLVKAIIDTIFSASVIATLIEGVWPGVTASAPFLAFWGMLSCVFWACDLIFISNAYLKLFPSEGSI
jgi:hypothetical protein